MTTYRLFTLQPACQDAIDDRVDEWHEGGGFGVPLHTFLGMTEQQYAEWVEGPEPKLPAR